MYLNGKSVLVTGGTGSFGKEFVKVVLRSHSPRKLIVFSRDELKQHEMRSAGYTDSRLRYFIGDVRDLDRLRRAMEDVDIVVHAAAMKQVPACEYNPFEAIQTNILGARNVIDAALDSDVSRVVALSTDKAVNPVNLYGATKLCAEKLFVQSNAYASGHETRFCCVRYGNVVGSRGSVVPLFRGQAKNGQVTVTDRRMTRFYITLARSVSFVVECIDQMQGGEVFVPKIPSMNIMDLVEVVASGCEIEFIGIRAGEKLHEVLISQDESRRTVDVGDKFVIRPLHSWWSSENWVHGQPVSEDFVYSSDRTAETLGVDELRAWLEQVP